MIVFELQKHEMKHYYIYFYCTFNALRTLRDTYWVIHNVSMNAKYKIFNEKKDNLIDIFQHDMLDMSKLFCISNNLKQNKHQAITLILSVFENNKYIGIITISKSFINMQ